MSLFVQAAVSQRSIYKVVFLIILLGVLNALAVMTSNVVLNVPAVWSCTNFCPDKFSSVGLLESDTFNNRRIVCDSSRDWRILSSFKPFYWVLRNAFMAKLEI